MDSLQAILLAAKVRREVLWAAPRRDQSERVDNTLRVCGRFVIVKFGGAAPRPPLERTNCGQDVLKGSFSWRVKAVEV
ncbi:MAG TPA: hypothetical protein VLJ80_15080 [Solirubrobacteraceae bacterium]|nr:hypothetical protein [Solirubrobacteraceae bacterium]